jgi:cytidylate kinase
MYTVPIRQNDLLDSVQTGVTMGTKGVTSMTDNIIITIGRQFGSGGHEIGNRLSKRLDIPLYDHNLIKMAAKELNITPEMAQKVDESVLEHYMSSAILGSGDYIMFMNGQEFEEPLSDQVFEMQTQIIQKMAKRSSCIIVGRCADYILGDYSNCINAFIYAYKEDRIRRIMKLYNLTERQAWDKIKKVDRTRKAYYEEHTKRDWGSIEAHQMLFNASLLGLDGVVDALEGIYKKWNGQ